MASHAEFDSWMQAARIPSRAKAAGYLDVEQEYLRYQLLHRGITHFLRMKMYLLFCIRNAVVPTMSPELLRNSVDWSATKTARVAWV